MLYAVKFAVYWTTVLYSERMNGKCLYDSRIPFLTTDKVIIIIIIIIITTTGAAADKAASTKEAKYIRATGEQPYVCSSCC